MRLTFVFISLLSLFATSAWGSVSCTPNSGSCSFAHGSNGCRIEAGAVCTIVSAGPCTRVTNLNTTAIFISAQGFIRTDDFATFLSNAQAAWMIKDVCNCTFNGNTINEGASVTAYLSDSVPFGGTCASQTRTCSGGILSGSYAFASCSVQSANNCTFNGNNVNHGASVTAFQSASVACGNSCVSESRSCNNGTLSGSFTNASCSAAGCSNCTLDGKTATHGSGDFWFSATSVPFGGDCASVRQYRSCNNGALDGSASFQFASCSVAGATGCTGQSLSWSVGGTTCTASTAARNNGESMTISSSSPTGSANFLCSNGSWQLQAGSTCSAGEVCPNNAIRVNPSTGVAEYCSSGSWLPRSVTTWCTPPWEVKIDDDEWMRFHQTAFKAQGEWCELWQRSNSEGTTIVGPNVRSSDDSSTRPCSNNSNCLVNESTPVANQTCAARTLAWTSGSSTCYFNAPATGHGGAYAVEDNTGPHYGNANVNCTHGVWTIYPGYCGTSALNCTGDPGMMPYWPPSYVCDNYNSVGWCCDSMDGYSQCRGYNSACN